MPCCKNTPDQERRHGWRLIAVCLLASFWYATTLWAAGIEVRQARLMQNEEAYVLSADFNIDLGNNLESIVARGVPLYFQLELEITRNRWFWPGEHIAGRLLNYKLSYNPLARRYRLTTGAGLHQDFSTLTEALRVMGRTVALPVTERSKLKNGETYQAALRLALDRQQLPKPLQLDAITDKAWTLETHVLNWSFVAGNDSELPGTP